MLRVGKWLPLPALWSINIFQSQFSLHESSLWVAFSFCMPGHSCSWNYFGEDSMVKRVFHVVAISYVSACITINFNVRFIFMLILRNCVLLMLGYFFVCLLFVFSADCVEQCCYVMEKMDKFREAFMKKFNDEKSRARI